jgi:hypothetical protein
MHISKRSVVTPPYPTARLPQSTTPTKRSTQKLIARLELVEKWIKYFLYGVAGLSLVAYGGMVYTQDQWKIHHRQLLKLQTQESQQAILNARLKDAQAQNAEKTQSGLVPPQPDQVLYVPAHSNPAAVTTRSVPAESPGALPGPVGY